MVNKPPASTAREPTPLSLTKPIRWCGWCRAYRTGCVLICLQDSATIPSAPTLYACGPCRTAHRLVPLADRPAR